jgi:hypothetical protein
MYDSQKASERISDSEMQAGQYDVNTREHHTRTRTAWLIRLIISFRDCVVSTVNVKFVLHSSLSNAGAGTQMWMQDWKQRQRHFPRVWQFVHNLHDCAVSLAAPGRCGLSARCRVINSTEKTHRDIYVHDIVLSRLRDWVVDRQRRDVQQRHEKHKAEENYDKQPQALRGIVKPTDVAPCLQEYEQSLLPCEETKERLDHGEAEERIEHTPNVRHQNEAQGPHRKIAAHRKRKLQSGAKHKNNQHHSANIQGSDIVGFHILWPNNTWPKEESKAENYAATHLVDVHVQKVHGRRHAK